MVFYALSLWQRKKERKEDDEKREKERGREMEKVGLAVSLSLLSASSLLAPSLFVACSRRFSFYTPEERERKDPARLLSLSLVAIPPFLQGRLSVSSFGG